MRRNADRPSRIEALEAFISRYLRNGAPALEDATTSVNAVLQAQNVTSPRLCLSFTVAMPVVLGVFDGAGKRQYEQATGRELQEDLRAALQVWLNAIYEEPGQPELLFEVKSLHEEGFDADVCFDYLSSVQAR